MFTLKRTTTITFALLLTVTIFGCRSSQSPAHGEGSIQFGPGEVVEGQLSDNKDDAPDDGSSADTSIDKFFAIKSIKSEASKKYISNSLDMQQTAMHNITSSYNYDVEGRLSEIITEIVESQERERDGSTEAIVSKIDIAMNVSWSGKRPEQAKLLMSMKDKLIRADGEEQERSKSQNYIIDFEYLSDGRLSKKIATKLIQNEEAQVTTTNYSYNGKIRSQEVTYEANGDGDGAVGFSVSSGTTTLEYGDNNLVKAMNVCFEPNNGEPYCNTDEYVYNSDNKLTFIKSVRPPRLIPLAGESIATEEITAIRSNESGMAIDYTNIITKYVDTLLTTEEGHKPTTTLNEDDFPVMEVEERVSTNDGGDTSTIKRVKRYTYAEMNKKPTMLPIEEHKELRNNVGLSILLVLDNPELLYLPLK
jgi:hypothetical protein